MLTLTPSREFKYKMAHSYATPFSEEGKTYQARQHEAARFALAKKLVNLFSPTRVFTIEYRNSEKRDNANRAIVTTVELDISCNVEIPERELNEEGFI